MAALRACGPRSKLNGLSAAHWLGMVREPPGVVEVIAPTERRVHGVIVSRARRIQPPGRIVRGISVTAPAWTLLDIAGRLDDEQLSRACHEAWVRWRCGAPLVQVELRRRPHAPGADRLRRDGVR